MTSTGSVYQLHPGGWLRRVDAAAPPLPPAALDQALADTLVPYARNLGFTQIELLSSPPPAGDAGSTPGAPLPVAGADTDPAAPTTVAGADRNPAAPRAAASPSDEPLDVLPRLAERCRGAGLELLPPGSSAQLVAASEDGMGFDDPWRTELAVELRRRLPKAAAADPRTLPDRPQRFAVLRARLALMWAQPGAKRVAMGSEFAQARPWTLDGGLDWHLLADPLHEGVQRLVHDLNHLRRESTALREPADAEFDGDEPGGGRRAPHAGFFWIERDNIDGGVLAFVRVAVVEAPHGNAPGGASPGGASRGNPPRGAAPPGDAASGDVQPGNAPPGNAAGRHPDTAVAVAPAAAASAHGQPADAPDWLIAANLSAVAQPSYRFGVPRAGRWVERLYSGSTHYGGGGDGWPNGGAAVTEDVPWSGHAQSLVLALPARSTLLLEHRPR